MSTYIKAIACLFTFYLLCAQPTVAQTIQFPVVKGKVTDKKTKQPIPGVSVMEIDADGRFVKGTTTDMEGNYAIKPVNYEKHRLSISNIGYKSIKQSMSGRTTINFQLEDATLDMQEVIVVGGKKTDNGMLNISDRNSTLAASKISAKEM